MNGYRKIVIVVLLSVVGTPMAAGKDAELKEREKRHREAVVEGNTAFALDLYAKLSKQTKGDNLFFSPCSISTALAMTYGGARLIRKN